MWIHLAQITEINNSENQYLRDAGQQSSNQKLKEIALRIRSRHPCFEKSMVRCESWGRGETRKKNKIQIKNERRKD